jgi:hypothetical protein
LPVLTNFLIAMADQGSASDPLALSNGRKETTTGEYEASAKRERR